MKNAQVSTLLAKFSSKPIAPSHYKTPTSSSHLYHPFSLSLFPRKRKTSSPLPSSSLLKILSLKQTKKEKKRNNKLGNGEKRGRWL